MMKLRQKASEQRRILGSREDAQVLKAAIASFKSLQLVQLLRVTEDEDLQLLKYMRRHQELRVPLEWSTACTHSSQTIGQALWSAQVPWWRFSSPMLSPQSALFLVRGQKHSLPTLASRLTCLTLHFDDGTDLDQKMTELSGLFRDLFRMAEGMQAVHVGFPSYRPLNLPLEAVFHNVTWQKLVAFGVQGWKLDGKEILDMALRHKDRLKGLRLRDVYLKEGSSWKDVLVTLRESMTRMEWVSLRRIGYVRHFEGQGQGIEIPDDAAPDESDSETDGDEEEAALGTATDNPPATQISADEGDGGVDDVEVDMHFNGTDDDNDNDNNDIDSTEDDSDSDDEHGPEAHEMDFPDLEDSAETPTSAPCSNCCNGSREGRGQGCDAEELEDDGGVISNTKRKAWEKWVLRRCWDHDEA